MTNRFISFLIGFVSSYKTITEDIYNKLKKYTPEFVKSIDKEQYFKFETVEKYIKFITPYLTEAEKEALFIRPPYEQRFNNMIEVYDF